jgi:AAA15 family ATPase/GTPase
MITELEIKNYKSIRELNLPLGRINVFIGENGAGKSNILEVIALAAAAASNKLDHEFLSSRGVRVTSPEFMRPAFPDADRLVPIEIAIKTADDRNVTFELNNDNTLYAKWQSNISAGYEVSPNDEFKSALATLTDSDAPSPVSIQRLIKAAIRNINPATELSNFVIFSPENSALRTFDREGQIEPLGINGEGLLKLLSFHASRPDDATLANVKESLKLFDWFDDFVPESFPSGARLLVRDRYLAENIEDFDHRSANEGFFFLLFYFLLFNSELTPKFFAIDNIDASLNPKLCEKLVQELSALAKTNDKQAILTTHNPAVLDGLDLNDDEQRLFVVSRGRDGTTKVKRIQKPEPVNGNNLRLSELFIRGLIGGLPKGF